MFATESSQHIRGKITFFSLLFLFISPAIFALNFNSEKGLLSISADQQKIYMGKSVMIDAILTPPNGNDVTDYIIIPFVNKRRWGAHEFCNNLGKASFMIPLPNIGNAEIKMIAIPKSDANWYGTDDVNLLKTGTVMPKFGIVSNELEIDVCWRNFAKKTTTESVFAMQWEPWFSPDFNWSTSQAVPLMGFYDCTNPSVLRQHVLWFMDMGIDCIIVDWSNHLWNAKHWSQRNADSNIILHMTQMMLEVLADMRDEGLPVPKVALMPGLSNGPPATMVALNEEFDWIYQNFLRNSRFKGLWQYWDNKPLIIVLDTGVMGTKEGTTESAFRVPFFKQTLTGKGATEEFLDEFRKQQISVDDEHFTVRWMSSQNQLTEHDKLGYWSWMDGSLNPIVTYRNEEAESVTVATAFFPEYGWKDPNAFGRRNGWTYLQSFATALEKRPSFIMLHQFQEYTGQSEGKGYGENKNIYVDSYSVEYSDDIEPVSLTSPGYRKDKGGWGFYYVNMTKALIDVYNGVFDDVTIMAVAQPELVKKDLLFSWTTIGPDASGYIVYIDNKLVAGNIKKTTYSFPLRKLSKGTHSIKVVAKGVSTRYELSKYHLDTPLNMPVPLIVEESFNVE